MTKSKSRVGLPASGLSNLSPEATFLHLNTITIIMKLKAILITGGLLLSSWLAGSWAATDKEAASYLKVEKTPVLVGATD